MNIQELVSSLAQLVDEETSLLGKPGLPGLPGKHGPLVAAKQRLLEALELQLAEKQRTEPHWQRDMDDEERQLLAAAAAALMKASARNRSALERQLQLSDDLISAVSAELQRRRGVHNLTYAQAGNLREPIQPSPVSINSRL